MKHLTTTQVAALIEAAEGDRNKLLFRLTYEHGLRISECLGLTRGHVRRGFLMIRGKKKGKRTDERLSSETLRLFESVTATLLPNTLIFPFSRQWASLLFHRACQKAGITLQLRQGVHSLRHSLAHHLLDAGAPLPVVQKSLRHRSIGSTGVYLEADGRIGRFLACEGTSASRPTKYGASHCTRPFTMCTNHPPSPPTLAEIQEEIKETQCIGGCDAGSGRAGTRTSRGSGNNRGNNMNSGMHRMSAPTKPFRRRSGRRSWRQAGANCSEMACMKISRSISLDRVSLYATVQTSLEPFV